MSVNYIVLDASDEFGSDAHGKVDVESGSFENEFEKWSQEKSILER